MPDLTDESTTPPIRGERDVYTLYQQLLASWNNRDAAQFAALFVPDGQSVGFDGSSMEGAAAIAEHLSQIFADHPTGTYVGKVKSARPIAPGVVLLYAIAGMVPPGQPEINPAVNSIQTLVTVKRDDRWRIALFQNTPAAFHGRPELVEAQTAELREELQQQSTEDSAGPDRT